ncbi:hypothetical protein KP509_36G053000 [Ceratopteris richardii]|nr:hypothetical protein KP509_36G053000 [Ceratopteris richardii]
MFNGDMIVHIPEESKHCPNLLLNNHASMIVGHTDPAPLMKVFQQIGQRPPHALLVGRLMVPEKADMLSAEFLKVLIEKDLTDLQEAVNQSSTSIRPILESGSHILRSHVQTLTSILESKKDDTFYRLDASSCYYVDMSGVKHLAEPERLQQAKISFSPLLQVVIEGINRNQSRRMGLKLICACFLRVKVKEAFVSSGDRLGLNILARVLSDPDRPVSVSSIRKKEDSEKAANEVFEWKDLRLSFKTEVNDVNEFCAMLSQMEKECINALNCAREGMSHLSTSLKMCEKQVA